MLGRSRFQSISRPSNLPFDILDADLLSRLLVIVEPFAFRQVDPAELGPGIDALGLPLPLMLIS